MVTGIDVHVYVVQDFERALSFYEALLGRNPSTLMPGVSPGSRATSSPSPFPRSALRSTW